MLDDDSSKLSFPKASLLIPMLLVILAALYASIFHQALHGEETDRFFAMINGKESIWNFMQTRYFNIILQIPARMILHYLPIRQSSVELAKHVHSFTYAFYPILGLIGCLIILKQAGRMDLFYFPLISHGLIAEICLGEVSCKGVQSIVLFWPIYFLAFFGEDRGRGLPRIYGPLLPLLILSLTLSYELSVSLLFFISLLYVHKYTRGRFLTGRDLMPLGVTIVAIVILLIVLSRSSVSTGNAQEYVDASLSEIRLTFNPQGISENQGFSFYANWLFIIFSAYLTYWMLWEKLISTSRLPLLMMNHLMLGLSSLLVLHFLYSVSTKTIHPFVGAFSGRLLIFPKTILLATLAFTMRRGLTLEANTKVAFSIFAMLVFVLSTYHNILTTKSLKDGDDLLLKIGEKNPGCHFMRQEGLDWPFLKKYAIHDFNIFSQSILIQRKRRLDFILFMGQEVYEGRNVNPCRGQNRDEILVVTNRKNPYLRKFPINPKKFPVYYDFSKVLK